jgi:hypothetical protein
MKSKTAKAKTKRFKCGHCGWEFGAAEARGGTLGVLVPYHDWPQAARQMCPGAFTTPRILGDRRPLGIET